MNQCFDFDDNDDNINASDVSMSAVTGAATTTSSQLQTPLTQEFPSTANLTRQDIEALLAGWDPSRADAAWYRQSHAATTGSHDGATSDSAILGTGVGAKSNIVGQPPIDEEAFEAFIESMPEVKALRQESQRLLRESEEKASRNMTMQPSLEHIRRETQQLYDRARALEQSWPSVEQSMHEASKRFTPQNLLFSLTQHASKLHDESETLASAFVEGLPLEVALQPTSSSSLSLAQRTGLTPPDSGTATPTGRDADGDATFVRRYRALRTTYHRRNLIADRWSRGAVTWRDD